MTKIGSIKRVTFHFSQMKICWSFGWFSWLHGAKMWNNIYQEGGGLKGLVLSWLWFSDYPNMKAYSPSRRGWRVRYQRWQEALAVKGNLWSLTKTCDRQTGIQKNWQTDRHKDIGIDININIKQTNWPAIEVRLWEGVCIRGGRRWRLVPKNQQVGINPTGCSKSILWQYCWKKMLNNSLKEIQALAGSC